MVWPSTVIVSAVWRHLGLEAAQDGVVLQQVGQGRGVGQVVDSHDLDVRALLQQRAEVVTTDAAKAVDAYADRHEPISSLVRRRVEPASCMGCPRPPHDPTSRCSERPHVTFGHRPRAVARKCSAPCQRARRGRRAPLRARSGPARTSRITAAPPARRGAGAQRSRSPATARARRVQPTRLSAISSVRLDSVPGMPRS